MILIVSHCTHCTQSTVSTVNFFNELEKVLHIIFYWNYRPRQIQAKTISFSGFITQFYTRIIEKKNPTVVEHICLHHSIIHFCTDRSDKLKHLSNHFGKKSSYFLGKVAGEFPQTNGNLDIKILDYSLSQHLKEFNNYFL